MDPSFLLTIVVVVIGFFVIFRKYRSHQEDEEIYSSSSPTSPLTSSSLSHNWTHDVFPSFRGEDVRRDFLSHIQKEFQRKGITHFIDNEIKRGESIDPELIRAIRGSKIAIVLLSRNYASSKWCLDELVEIMKCREELGQIVFAIFYKVAPSEVKKLTGDFGKVFRKTCVGRSKEETERWRQALEKVAIIAGYHSINWDNEAAMIEKIASDVSRELINSAPSSDFDGFIGMRTHMKNMEQFLRLDSDEVRMIGIWGPSGIGKSTIARVLFVEYSHMFQLSVFMENIKRRYPKPYSYNAQLQLQREFLSQIISQDDIKIHHLGVVKDRLKDKRVLVVLDDVDHVMQLDALAKEARWFGPGSRIIITTQDKRVLNGHGINHIYQVGFPSDRKAIKIFCMYAFGQKSPSYGFESLAREITRLAGNLPLGLMVMGSHFRRMSKDEWTMELPRLQTSLDGEIRSILKFSYDALCDEDKDLFIYIACFFNGEKIEKMEALLTKNFHNVRQGLRVLVEKSLISIESWNFKLIRMHDLLARFGRDIVRKLDPRQRQFLVDARETSQVLSNYTGSENVIGVSYNHSEAEDELYKNDKVFQKMTSLQFLSVTDTYLRVQLPRSLKYLPRKLRLLDWHLFPLTCLPSDFDTEFLVKIYMSCSNLEKLWEGNQTIANLKWMNVSYSRNLKELPDLSTATNLRGLNLNDCSSLVELPSSIGNAINLKKLKLSDCTSLVELPSSIGNATNLKKLNLYGCSSLVELTSSIGNAINLKKLNLHGCTSLVDLSYSIGNAINLKELDLHGCSSLVKLPSSIGNAINLKKLNLHGCSNLVKLPSSIGNAINLKKLNLHGCTSLVDLSYSIGNAINLKELNLNDCSSLVELPSSIGNAINLKKLNLRGCSSLVDLPSSIGNATNLECLNLIDCSSLVKLPSSIGNATNLIELDLLGCSSLVELPSSIENAFKFKFSGLVGCSSLVKLPSFIGNLISLEELNLHGCSSLVELPSSIGKAINLKKLNLSGCSSLVKLPSSIGNTTNLKDLELSGCSSLVELPSSIGNLHKLWILTLKRCSKLETLPININMESLYALDLADCSLLKTFPEISTNVNELMLNGTAIEEIPSSIRTWSHLFHFAMPYNENLGKSPYAFGCITELHVCDKRIRELAPWIKGMSRLKKLVISGCTRLISLPRLPNSLRFLKAENCESLERLDSSIENATNLEELSLSGCSSLVELPSSIGNFHKLGLLTLKGFSKLEVLPININMTSLYKLVISGCTKLVSLPQLPDSLWFLEAENCESLERLHSSFHNRKDVDANFGSCFKLNQEARDLIIRTCRNAILPGEKVPTYFLWRATGSSLSVKWTGTYAQTMRFTACVLLVNKGDVEVGDRKELSVSYCIKDKQNGASVNLGFGYAYHFPLLHKHLYMFKIEEKAKCEELVFEFEVEDEKWEIRECGLNFVTNL